MEFIPYILSFFSNPPVGREGHLYYVGEEREGLQTRFTYADRVIKYIPVTDKLDRGKVSESVALYWKKYTVVHYSGHADSFSLELPDEKLRADNFIEFISVCDSLKLVVLNGCSTQGFVKRLLEATTVKVVIATPRPVNDDTAMKFSLQLYDNLLNDIAIEKAFTYALAATLGEKFSPDANVFRIDMKDGTIRGMEILSGKKEGSNERGVKKAGAAVMNSKEGTTWGLYVKDVQALEWKLFATGDDEAARAEDVKKQIRLLQENIIALQQEEDKLASQIGNLKTNFPDEEAIKEVVAEKELTLAEKRKELDKKLKEKDDLKNNLLNLAAEQNDELVISIYENAVKKLNFSRQKIFVDQIRTNNTLSKMTAFILHGTSQCCLNQLTRNLVYWLGAIKIDNKSIIDYNSFHQEDEIWEKLRIDFGLNAPGDDPALIVQEIQRRYRDEYGNTQNNFAVLFRNSSKDLFADAAMRKKIFGFWETFTGYFLLADKEHPTCQHRIYMFLIDDQCTLVESPPSFISSREKDYKMFAPDKQAGEVSIQLMPAVVPVAATDIPGWETENGIPENYWYSPTDLEDIFSTTEGLLLPTIREISSRKIKTQARKFRAFQSFVSSIQNPL